MSEQTMTVLVNASDDLEAAFFKSWECDETTHYFDKVPGRCRCKREVWEPDPPRLRIVK